MENNPNVGKPTTTTTASIALRTTHGKEILADGYWCRRCQNPELHQPRLQQSGNCAGGLCFVSCFVVFSEYIVKR